MSRDRKETSRRSIKEARDRLGRGSVILYLDFDGVLHHENTLWHPKQGAFLCAPPGHRLFQHADLLAEILAPYPDTLIVLSTSWVLRYGHARTSRRLPAALRQRVIGSTYHSSMNLDNFRQLSRGQQVLADVGRRMPLNWLALDDDSQGWPESCRENLVRTDEVLGLSAPAVQDELRAKLQRL